MKRVLCSLLLITLLLFLCGCTIKNENNMTITYNGKVNLSTTIAFDKEILSNTIKLSNISNNKIDDVTDDDMINYLNENLNDSFFDGFEKENYIYEDFIGFTYSYMYDSIDDLVKDDEEEVIINDYSSNNKMKDLKIFYKEEDVYNANLVFKSLDSFNNSDEQITYYYLFTLKLPYKAISNNADNNNNDNKNLTWKLDNKKDNLISFSFKFSDYKYYPLYLLIIVLLIILILVIIIVKKKLMRIVNLMNIFLTFIFIGVVCVKFDDLNNIFEYNVIDSFNENVLLKKGNTVSINTNKLGSSLNSLSSYFKKEYDKEKLYDNAINNIINNNSFTYNDGKLYAVLKENDAESLFGDYCTIDNSTGVSLSLDNINEYDYSSVKENILRKKVVQTAQKQVGNDGWKYLHWYGLNYNAHWCAIFVSWVANENDLIKDDYFPKFSYVRAGYEYYQKRNQFKYRNEYTPKPGDVAFFNWDNDSIIDHVGIVEKIENNKVYVIEGNVDRTSVKRREYSLNSSYIYGYGIPNYSK